MESNHGTRRHQLPAVALPTLLDLMGHLVFPLQIKSTYGSL